MLSNPHAQAQGGVAMAWHHAVCLVAAWTVIAAATLAYLTR